MSSNISKTLQKIRTARIKISDQLTKCANSSYIVKPGDTLGEIAEKFYNDSDEWPTIYNANKDIIKDPNLIEPNWQLEIPNKPTGAKPPTGYKAKIQRSIPDDVEQYVKDQGMVDLSSVATVKNYPYAHPELAKLIQNIRNIKEVKFWRVTEAYPPSSKHSSKAHYNGRAIDFTIHNPQVSQQLTNWINSQGNFKALNEYDYKSKHSTGGHIHVEYIGSSHNLS